MQLEMSQVTIKSDKKRCPLSDFELTVASFLFTTETQTFFLSKRELSRLVTIIGT